MRHRRWPRPGGWYSGYAFASLKNGHTPGRFMLDEHGRETWVTFDPEWDRLFGLLR